MAFELREPLSIFPKQLAAVTHVFEFYRGLQLHLKCRAFPRSAQRLSERVGSHLCKFCEIFLGHRNANFAGCSFASAPKNLRQRTLMTMKFGLSAANGQ